MTLAQILGFNLALFAALVVPGPALLFALRQSVAGGLQAGVATGCGLALVAAGWTAAAFAGLEVLFQVVPYAYVLLKSAGAAYLIWIAIALWRDADKPIADSAQPGARAFLGGVLVNLLNPKSVLFAASVLVVIFPPDLPLAAKALVVANHFVVECLAYGLFALLLSSAPARQGYLRAKSALDRVAGALLGALGLRLLLDR